MSEMFCFQCQQTAHNTGCEGHTGVCGKKSDTANLQDELTGELIRLARAVAEALGDDGRILVRESGTEPVIRVMVEAATDELCEKYVTQVIDVIEKEGLIVE